MITSQHFHLIRQVLLLPRDRALRTFKIGTEYLSQSYKLEGQLNISDDPTDISVDGLFNIKVFFKNVGLDNARVLLIDKLLRFKIIDDRYVSVTICLPCPLKWLLIYCCYRLLNKLGGRDGSKSPVLTTVRANWL